jgi:hypothetical protein
MLSAFVLPSAQSLIPELFIFPAPSRQRLEACAPFEDGKVLYYLLLRRCTALRIPEKQGSIDYQNFIN